MKFGLKQIVGIVLIGIAVLLFFIALAILGITTPLNLYVLFAFIAPAIIGAIIGTYLLTKYNNGE